RGPERIIGVCSIVILYGVRLNGLARGIDESEVVPDCPTRSISVEDTFERDVPLAETEPMIRCLAAKVWSALHKESRIARPVVLKVKTRVFKILTLISTPSFPPTPSEELIDTALRLRERVDTAHSTPTDSLASKVPQCSQFW